MEDSMEVLQGLHISSIVDEENEQIDENFYDDDDDDDDEVCIPVTLGFVEKPDKSWPLLRQLFPSKAGGSPAWLDPVNLPSGRSAMCDLCEEPLQFLLQVFRCQLPRTYQFYSSNPPKHDGTDRPLVSGVPLCTWCGTWKGSKICSSCRWAHYCSEKHQAIHWRSGHKFKCRQIIVASQSSVVSLPSEEIQEVASTSLWKEYEIKIEDDCESDVDIPVEQLVDETGKLDVDGFKGDEDKISWATFQERVGKAPEQVIRYCRDPGGRPLWPVSSGRPPKAEIPKCSYCGGDRSFEFQILPQLLYYLGVQNETNSLDWATIAIYTCGESCESSTAYKEEFAWLQLSSQST